MNKLKEDIIILRNKISNLENEVSVLKNHLEEQEYSYGQSLLISLVNNMVGTYWDIIDYNLLSFNIEHGIPDEINALYGDDNIVGDIVYENEYIILQYTSKYQYFSIYIHCKISLVEVVDIYKINVIIDNSFEKKVADLSAKLDDDTAEYKKYYDIYFKYL